ncbi:hypothetical protein PILCRDRAFT_818694 [Piloderma croceum F 1598]|uniref:Uncharacterized protein n=1 Tax=Piloderma croceum (strain F 1598) TaxID=765440 RepID=A0A0C3G0X0_PILCF|nr:hypothetical protein PILCRDRAFT_818694 [Piloderma croceum F 1598]
MGKPLRSYQGRPIPDVAGTYIAIGCLRKARIYKSTTISALLTLFTISDPAYVDARGPWQRVYNYS